MNLIVFYLKPLRYLLVMLFFIIGCDDALDNPNSIPYSLTFQSYWSKNTNTPLGFPANAHFSDLIGLIHHKDVDIFKVDEFASLGLKEMALYGKPNPLNKEIFNLISEGKASKGIVGEGITSTPNKTVFNFQVVDNPDISYVTIITKIAPGPDWFAAIKVSLYENGNWKDKVEVKVEMYDAGVEGQNMFNFDRSIPENKKISRLTTPIEVNGVIPIFGKITIARK